MVEINDPNAVKRKYGVPNLLATCHTGLIGDYFLEGHIPAADIRRLMRERPKIKGLAVPGMPAGSPGMEGGPAQRYQVLSVNPDGTTRVFASH
jgi:hypothetical protein